MNYPLLITITPLLLWWAIGICWGAWESWRANR